MTTKENKHKHTSGAEPAELFLLNQLDAKDPKDLSSSCNDLHKRIDYTILKNFLDSANAASAKLAAVRADANSSDDDKKSALTDFVKEAKGVDDILSDIKAHGAPRFSGFQDALKAYILVAESVQLPNDFDLMHNDVFKVRLEKVNAQYNYYLDPKVATKLESAVGDANHSVDKVIAARALQDNEAPTKEELGVLYTKAKDDLTKVVTIATEMSTNLSEVSPRITMLLESVKSAPAEVIFDIGFILDGSNNNEPNNFSDHLVSLDTALNSQYERLDSKMHYLDFKAIVLECANDLIGVIEY